jgi:hypothetical protein
VFDIKWQRRRTDNSPVRTSAICAASLTVLCVLPLQAHAADPAPTPDQQADQQAEALLPPPALDNPTTAWITPTSTTLKLSTTRDYVVRVRPGSVLTRGVIIMGGHDVVLQSAVLQYARPSGASADWKTRGLYLKGQTGEAYVDGLTVRGPLNEGINLDQRMPGAVVVLKNIDISLIIGSYNGHHADLLQTWAGPSKLVVDGFTGVSDYQGFFLEPNSQWKGPRPKLFWMRDVDLDLRTGAYGLWTDGWGAYPIYARSTAVRHNPNRPSRDQWLWPKPSSGDTTWDEVLGQ